MKKLQSLGKEFYKSIEDKLIYIDSNVFMDEKFKNILENFEEYKLNIVIPKEQYDELYNLKQSNDGEKSKKARDAFKSLENLLDLKILKIEDINQEHVNSNAYADAVFINKIAQNIKDNKSVVFFTDDADLRIRVKSLNDKNNLLTLYGFKELMILSDSEQERIKEEENIKRQEQEEAEKRKKANRTTFKKVTDGTLKVAKGVGIVAVALTAALLSE